MAPLNARMEQVRGTLRELEGEMGAVEAELEALSADRQRFDALREACNLLERLEQLEAGELFWGEVPEVPDPAGRVARVRTRVARFDDHIGGILTKQTDLKAHANRCVDELDCLYEDIHDAHARDERREEEFAIVRELSEVPEHELVMPWSHNAESERRYRRAISTAMLLSLLLSIVIRIVHVPPPLRPAVVEVPERLAMMVRKEHKPEPVKKPKGEKKEAKKEEKVAAKKEGPPQPGKAQAKPQDHPRAEAAPGDAAPAPKKSQNTGMLAFKDSFKDLLDETPTPKLGAEARLANPATHAAGAALASRSLVSMNGGGPGSGGGAAFSRNVGSGGIGGSGVGRSIGGSGNGSGRGNDSRIGRGGAGFAQVKSSIASAAGKEGKALTSGARPARTDEEIQILFDRYKAALYRIYNTELRKDPTLRGKMVLRITIEPSGAVSGCAVESCNMDAPAFSSQIVDRVRRFNFGAKDGVPKTTILYPIDFLPAR